MREVPEDRLSGHFRREGFEQVNEIHGCIERLLCVSCGAVNVPPTTARFDIDEQTRLAPNTPNPGLPGGMNHPICVKCEEKEEKLTLRPEVVLFTDDEILPFMADIHSSAALYQEWEAAMEQDVVALCSLLAGHRLNAVSLQVENNKRVVILELGCGIRVPSVRLLSTCLSISFIRCRVECEEVICDLLEKLQHQHAPDSPDGTATSRATLIRVIMI